MLLLSMLSGICDVNAVQAVNMLQCNDNKIKFFTVPSKLTKHLHDLPTSITNGDASNTQIAFIECEEYEFYIRQILRISKIS